MAYLHRLIICAVLALSAWLPTTSNASAPSWGPWSPSDPATGLAAEYAASTLPANGWTRVADFSGFNASGEVRAGRATCTDAVKCQSQTGVTGPFGSFYTRPAVCTAPDSWSSAQGTCVSPDPCTAGTPATMPVSLGWFAPDNQVGIYSAQAAVTSQCVTGTNGKSCTINVTGSNAAPIGVPGSNGFSNYTGFLKGTMAGGAQCSPTTPVATPEPPCLGQSGVYNSKTVCLPPESAQSKNDRAASAAAAAASAARLAAINAGRTEAVANAAAAAAGQAAAQAVQNGGSVSQAAAAGAAAGTAAASASAGGASSSSTMSQGSAAGAGQLAHDRATQIATAAGLSPTLIAQAASSASAAAATAAAAVLNNGGTVAQANAAAAVAGQAATASIIYGASTAEAGNNGAAAGAGSVAGSVGGNGSGTTSGTGPPAPQDPVGDFCAKNPQAQMCKNTPDSSFGGACGAPPVCEGDAVMCAVAASTFATNCTLSNPNTPTPLYDAAIGKTGDQTGSLSGNSTVSVAANQFDQTELLGSAAGMSDRSVTVAGHVISIPFSSVNIWLVRLGLVLQAVTFLVCARIVIRG